MAEYRASLTIDLTIESSSLLRAQEHIAEEITGLFAGAGTVEITGSNIRVDERADDTGFPGGITGESMDLTRRMVEAIERIHPKKPEWDKDDDRAEG